MNIEEPDNDELIFSDEIEESELDEGTWKIIVVDDEPEVQKVTRLILKDLKFENRSIEFIDAYSGEEAIELVKQHPDASMILLDVIMEEDDSGLQVVKFIREQEKNRAIRIILRTGQPGQFPEEDVVINYDIDDYKSKTELTKPKMITTVVSSLRAFKNILELEKLSKSLEIKVEERTEEIKNQNEELKELNQYKNDILGVVAHDLRTPLHHIKGFIALLKMGAVETKEELTEYYDNILLATDRLNGMITRILDVNAIESKNINLKIERVDLGLMLKNVVDTFEVTANQKQINLVRSINQNSYFAKVDESYLIQVLENLISNAIKFSKSNKKIFISVQQDDNIKIIVKDEGPGISEEDQTKLFGAFQQLTAKPTAGEATSGLGLSIAKKYVDAMNGRLFCESRLGEGASFIIEFKSAL